MGDEGACRRLGVKDEWVYEDPWEALRKALSDAFEDGTFDDLLGGRVLRLRKREMSTYQTPSGKIEFYSYKAESLGLSPLPKQVPVRDGEGLFVLINSSTHRYTHTQFREVYGPIPPIVVINPEDAARLGIKQGDVVVLRNDLGELYLKAVVSDDVPSGVVWSPRQLVVVRGTPQNTIVSDGRQRLGGGPVFNSTLVKLLRGGRHTLEFSQIPS